ncbi:MAG: hypothetical protein KC516_03135 [Nanoarchaeota archaeon]|nr:hypothetical protein [Nanoarchaeota archaeon]
MFSIEGFIAKNKEKSVPNYTSWTREYGFEGLNAPNFSTYPFMIYSVGENKVAKFLYGGGSFISTVSGKDVLINQTEEITTRLIENNYLIAKGLYDEGISVPEPIGLRLVKNKLQHTLHPAFVMKETRRDFGLLNQPEREIVRKRVSDEIKKAEKLGFVPRFEDNARNNFTYDAETDKVYLIGLSTWKFKK